MHAEYRASIWQRLDEVGLALLFTGIFASPFFAGFQGLELIHWVLWLFFGVLAVGAWLLFFLLIIRVELKGDRVLLASQFKTHEFLASELSSVQVTVGGKRHSAVTFKSVTGKAYTMLAKSFELSVVSAIQAWWAKHETKVAEPEVRRFKGSSSAWILVGIAAIFLVLTIGAALEGGQNGVAYAVMSGIVSAGLFLLGWAGLASYAEVSPVGITVRSFGRPKLIAWESIDSILLEYHATRRANFELMTIKHGMHETRLNEGYGEYPVLRDLILKRVPVQRVTDKRPRA